MEDNAAIRIALFNASLAVKLFQQVLPDLSVSGSARNEMKVRLAVRVKLSQSALSFSA